MRKGVSAIGEKTVADFFAGIGLVTMGLDRAGWKTVYALDYEPEKERAYTNHFGAGHYVTQDIAQTKGSDVPKVTLAHASFPCTDLSVAGGRAGIHKGESSAFWEFVRVVREMKKVHGEATPPYILLENVEGLLTSNNGNDLRALLSKLNELGYGVDLLRIDASNFVPQSRVRIFIIGVHDSIVSVMPMGSLEQEYAVASSDARPKKIIDYIRANEDLRWYFHQLPNLPLRTITLEEIIDHNEEWWDEKRTAYVLSQMHERHLTLIRQKMMEDEFSYLPAFRRMRMRDGEKRSTVEIRSDGIAGCLRTPKGGSARQIIARAGKGTFNVRLFNGIEAAKLMGAGDFAINPSLSLNQVLFGFGDAVCVPAVEWIGTHYLNSLPLTPNPAGQVLPGVLA
ncbi:MAG TPA: DNA (cytosine-5-)-methyltransferase [Candidatus Paceibacterota bacterium]|jgi:DNA (cytosine-5)-methyltransferase 1|nr:DNA (cytosine-5-)-methyltransferase [Candidatus Paceibacterota bacterium]